MRGQLSVVLVRRLARHTLSLHFTLKHNERLTTDNRLTLFNVEFGDEAMKVRAADAEPPGGGDLVAAFVL